jgi:hypothetical protein
VGVASSRDNVAAGCRSHKKINLIDYDCVVLSGLNVITNGLDYNLSHVFNQDMLVASF